MFPLVSKLGSYWPTLFSQLTRTLQKLYAKSYLLPWVSNIKMLKLLSLHKRILSNSDAVCLHKPCIWGQISSSLFTEHDNPQGTAGSLRASAVNKRAAAHLQWWCRRDGPSQTGGRQQGVTWFNGPNNEARPASRSLHTDIAL